MNDKVIADIRKIVKDHIVKAQRDKTGIRGVTISITSLPGTYMEQSMALSILEPQGYSIRDVNDCWTITW